MKKKRTPHKTFRSVQNLLELQCLVDELVDFLELSMILNAYLPYIYYLMKWLGHCDFF